MRHLLSVLIIAFSISAILGGFFSGRAAVPHVQPPSTPAPRSAADEQLLLKAAPIDETAHDVFAADAAVVLPSSGAPIREDARIALVIVGAGRSFALESPFLALNVPVTLVVNPSGNAASAIVAQARARDDAVYVQIGMPFTAGALREMQRKFAGMSGVASRLTGGVQPAELAALRAAHLAFFDEYGEDGAAAARFAAAGVRYAARGITVDDHAQQTYVGYMLAQAVHLARGRTAVVMARAFPGTLQAFIDLLSRASREGIHVVALER